MTWQEVLAVSGCLYVLAGVMNTLQNWDSNMARLHREQCIQHKRYILLVLGPIVMTLIWPVKFWLMWRLRKLERSGELARIVHEAHQEEEAEQKAAREERRKKLRGEE